MAKVTSLGGIFFKANDPKAQNYEYGRFAWIMDPEGNKIELWGPIDEEYDKMLDKNDITGADS